MSTSQLAPHPTPERPAPAPVRRSGRRPGVLGSAFAALVTVVAVCSGDAVARVFPYGHRHRSVNDLGNQFVPFHAHLWDLLHGRARGGLLFNWQSGYGTSFLPDLGTYLSSPFALLVGLFPRHDIDLAVYVVTVLKMAAAAAAMAWLLRTQRPGPWWAAGLLGASYALCGWSVIEASYNPMWLDGLIAFPMLCLTGEWALRGRRPLLGVLVVAVSWTANFYTAYMATLGAALVLLVRVVLTREGVRERARVIGRAAVTTVLGMALTAPLLVPLFLSSKQAYPGWFKEFSPVPWSDLFARLMPATYSFGSPAVFVGTGTLLLVAALPFHGALPARTRLWWAGLVAAVLLSLQWAPTHLAWHVFATPNGSPYRQTFVLAGIVVIAAWTGLSAGLPAVGALAGGAGVLAAAAAWAAGSALATGWGYALFCGGLALTAAAWWALGRRRLLLPAAAVLAAALVAQAAATTAYGHKATLAGLDDYPSWGRSHTSRERALTRADGWPAYRTDAGRPALSGNDPLLLGGEGGSYYSSHTPDVLTRTMAALGAGWTSRGRSVQSLDNPVTDALFSVGARLKADGKVVRAEALPLVTVRPAGPPQRFGDSPFANQELLLGAKVYEEPVAPGVCRSGTDPFLWAPEYSGSASLADGRPSRLNGTQPKNRAALQPLGRSHGASSQLVFDRPAPARWTLGCLDRSKLTAAVAALRAPAATSVRVSDAGLTATLPAGSTGTAVVAVPAVAGWSCQGRPAGSRLGLLAVPLDGRTTTLHCAFTPPGLLPGAGLAGLSALVVAALAVHRRRPSYLTALTRRGRRG
ncbi:YfhO family protein [Streptomyces sp. NPDC089915]|uniref:YfhO family protein n=1 Tax=Streptomyces sp. NPDC089915 TaxID=3155186 RepID=UPI0034131D9C